MNDRHDNKRAQAPLDAGRRRLTKAGLATPAILGVLASRPVLGNHHCTPSGHISGFASPRPDALPCGGLGQSPEYFARLAPSSWPGAGDSVFADGEMPLDFSKAPANSSPADTFEMAFVVVNSDPAVDTREATVGEVLGQSLGANETLQSANANVDIALGAEFLAAAMSAVSDPVGYPVPLEHIVDWFNTLLTGNPVMVTGDASWNAEEVRAYLQSLYES